MRQILACGALLVLGCIALNPSVEEAVNQFGPVLCDRVAACNKAGYDAKFPEGQTQCVNAQKDAIKAKFGGDALSKQSACSQEELDACIADLKNAPCDVLQDTSKLPTSCAKC